MDDSEEPPPEDPRGTIHCPHYLQLVLELNGHWQRFERDRLSRADLFVAICKSVRRYARAVQPLKRPK